MNVEIAPVQQEPNVVITMSWEEAGVLRAIGRGVRGRGLSEDVIYRLEDELVKVGVPYCGPKFRGSFAE